MKRLLAFALLLGTALSVGAQAPTQVARATLANAWDLDGEAADADQIVTAANGDLLDSTTFTITADPDVCRLVDMTVTDANSSISAGVLTVVGTGCLGEARSCSFTFAAGGSGVKTLTCTGGEGAYFADVTSVSTGALTGEGGAGVDFMTLGYTANSVNGWPMYGKVTGPGPNGERGVDPFGWLDIQYRITTSGVLSTTVTGVTGAEDAFASVSVGDLLVVHINGVTYERKVTAKASADSITVESPGLNIPAAGQAYRFRKFFFSTNPAQVLAIPVHGYKSVQFVWAVDVNANTGGVVALLQCTSGGTDYPTAEWEQVMTSTIASGAAQVPISEGISLEALPYSFCRFGFSFGTGDDADAAAEEIELRVSLLR